MTATERAGEREWDGNRERRLFVLYNVSRCAAVAGCHIAVVPRKPNLLRENLFAVA